MLYRTKPVTLKVCSFIKLQTVQCPVMPLARNNEVMFVIKCWACIYQILRNSYYTYNIIYVLRNQQQWSFREFCVCNSVIIVRVHKKAVLHSQMTYLCELIFCAKSVCKLTIISSLFIVSLNASEHVTFLYRLRRAISY